ncbi:MAG: serine protease [Gracilibacteraceae bacterium]|jgi:membrane-bound serine protease (ClpP class)|nr:serine protease [Gracilibacteraceae bacterium]
MFRDWGLLTAFLYVMGMVLLMVEALAPGFGVAGISGIILVLASIVMISSSFFQAMLLLIGTIAITVLLVVALYRMGYGKRFVKSMILNTEQKNEEGYVSTKGYDKYLGMRGIVATPLRSAGTVLIDGNRIDAVSEAEFIDKGVEVEVIKIEGSRIVVKKV